MAHCREQKGIKRRRAIEADQAAAFLAAVDSMPRRARKCALVKFRRRKNGPTCLKLAIRDIAKQARGCKTVSFADIADISNCSLSAEYAASKFNLTPTWINTLRCFHAGAALHHQNRSLGKLISFCQEEHPLFVMWRLAWDETGERVTVPAAGLTPQQQASTWQVMVVRLEIFVGWNICMVVQSSIVVPNMLVASPTAENMYNCIFYHKGLLPYRASLRLLCALSKWSLELHETDGAYANTRLRAHLLRQQDRAKTLDCGFVCRLHATQLIEAALVAQLPGNILSRLYSLTLLLRTSGHFARMVHTLDSLARRVHLRETLLDLFSRLLGFRVMASGAWGNLQRCVRQVLRRVPPD